MARTGRPIGRPRLPEGTALSYSVSATFTEAERDALDRAADEFHAGNRAECVRNGVLRYLQILERRRTRRAK